MGATETNETLEIILANYRAWRRAQFDPTAPGSLLLRAVGEIGELAAAHEDELRGGPVTETMDGVGDTVLFLEAYCAERGWLLRDCVELAWGQVRPRDYRRWPRTGRAHLEASRSRKAGDE